MWTREQKQEYQRQWRAQNRDKINAHRRDYYSKNRAYIIRQQTEYSKKHPEVAQAYYVQNRDRIIEYNQNYYREHREERINYSKEYRRKSCVPSKNFRSNGYIREVNKTPYPTDEKCAYCKRVSYKSLHWHHWDDQFPEDGFWVCSSCLTHIEALFAKSPDKLKFINDIKLQLSLR